MCGAAMLVPLRRPNEPGSDERTCTPGAVTSGFMASDTGVGPADEKSATTPFAPAAATVIAPEALPGDETEPIPNSPKSLPAAITGTTPAAAARLIAVTSMSRGGSISRAPAGWVDTPHP